MCVVETNMKIISTRQAANTFGLKILVHGPPGAGKTRLCATTGDLGRTLIISVEGGLLSVRDWDIDVVQVRTIDDVYEVFEYLKKEGDAYTWVCLDSISEIAEIVLAGEKLRNRDARRAYGEMADTVFDLIRGFRNLNCHVLMTAKQGREEIDGRTLHGPLLPGRQLTLNVAYLFDEVFALRVETNSEGEIIRVLQTGRSRSYDAKDRSGSLNMFEDADLAAVAAKIQAKHAHLDAEEAAVEEEEPEVTQVPEEPSEPEIEQVPVELSAPVIEPVAAQQPLTASNQDAVPAVMTAKENPQGNNGPDISPVKGTQRAPVAKAKRRPKPVIEPKTRVATPALAKDATRTNVSASGSTRLPGAQAELRRAHLRRQLFMLLKEGKFDNEQITSYILARCALEFGVGTIQDVPVKVLELWAKELEEFEPRGRGKRPSERKAHVLQMLKKYDVWKRAA